MTEKDTQALEDNLPMVNYIMLHRIYDVLTLVANLLAKDDADKENVAKMVEYHNQGFLLGPAPAYTSNEDNDE